MNASWISGQWFIELIGHPVHHRAFSSHLSFTNQTRIPSHVVWVLCLKEITMQGVSSVSANLVCPWWGFSIPSQMTRFGKHEALQKLLIDWAFPTPRVEIQLVEAYRGISSRPSARNNSHASSGIDLELWNLYMQVRADRIREYEYDDSVNC